MANIKAYRRQIEGKSKVKELRRQGFVPGVVYGGASGANIPVKFSARELAAALASATESAFLTMTLEDGSSHLVLPREIQYTTIRRDLRHIDFLIVEQDEEVRTTVPVRIIGTNDEPLQYGLLEIEVRAKPAFIPVAFEVDVTNLEMGDSIFVSDLEIPKEVELFSEPEEMILGVVTSSEEIVDEDEEEAVEEGAEAAAETEEPEESPEA